MSMEPMEVEGGKARAPSAPSAATTAANSSSNSKKDGACGGNCCCYCAICACVSVVLAFVLAIVVWYALCGSLTDRSPTAAMDGISTPDPSEVVFMGDSNVDYWDGSGAVDEPCSDCGGGTTWAATKAAAAADAGVTTAYNIGVSGTTCKQWVDATDSMLTKFRPKDVVLHCGQNDLTFGEGCGFFGVNPSTVDAAYADVSTIITKILGSAAAPSARIFYVSTVPEPLSDGQELQDNYRAYDGKVKAKALALAAQNATAPPRLVFIDAHSGFQDQNCGPKCWGNDALHLNGVGYAYWNAWLHAAMNTTAANEKCIVWRNGVCTDRN